jgi:hypothetical protein
MELSLGVGSRSDEKATRAIPSIVAFVSGCQQPQNQQQIIAGVKPEGFGESSVRKAIPLAVKRGELREVPGPKKNLVLYEVPPPAPPPDDPPF